MPEITSLAVLISLLAIVLLAGLVHGTLGLGFPMLATPLLALFTDVRSAILITLLPTMAVNIISILKGGSWRMSIGRYWPLAVYVPFASVLGTYLLIITDPTPFKLLLAAVILLYLNLNRVRGLSLGWVREKPFLAYAVFGLIGGFLAGTVNVMVPVLIVLTLELGLAPTVMVQVFNLCFLAGKLSQAATFAYAGILDGPMLLATAPLALLAVAALLVGMEIRKRVDAATYRGWLRKVLFIIALVLILQVIAL
jgi:uncharacterized membrane protein YfcA